MPHLEKASTATDPVKTAKNKFLKLHKKRKGPAQIQYRGDNEGHGALRPSLEISYQGIGDVQEVRERWFKSDLKLEVYI